MLFPLAESRVLGWKQRRGREECVEAERSPLFSDSNRIAVNHQESENNSDRSNLPFSERPPSRPAYFDKNK
ncbi:hypothetical protein [Bacillus sp. FJAT-27264]|uniref:hypothetical protein n=1 Tax=Paenibacillus sp. (strain DSM 101736 / FJAT-27264) TaxID=1850362 RepID=UPI001112712D|nr:hypothetical protein [Bacillus sp. FJAT-27264]